MKTQAIDRIDVALNAWRATHPELDFTDAAVTLRLVLLGKYLEAHATRSFAPFGLQPWEFDVLSTLGRDGPPYTLSAGELARSVFLTCGAMTHRLDRLEERGLVERRPSPEDRRSVLVSLTEQGRDLMNQALHKRLGDVRRLMSVLSKTEREQLQDLLRRLTTALEQEQGGCPLGD